MKKINFNKLPCHMREAARRYIEEGFPAGNFLSAVLRNDLVGAFGAADQINADAMKDWASWLYNDIPADAWKTQSNINDWIEKGGLKKHDQQESNK